MHRGAWSIEEDVLFGIQAAEQRRKVVFVKGRFCEEVFFIFFGNHFLAIAVVSIRSKHTGRALA
jgi:hypothetical protein